jgi:hypothetical protein
VISALNSFPLKRAIECFRAPAKSIRSPAMYSTGGAAHRSPRKKKAKLSVVPNLA